MRAKVRNDRVSANSYGLIVILGILSLSVLVQMLGMPGSLIDLLPHSGTTVASISEDVSLNPLTVEPKTPGLSRLHVIFQLSVQLPVLVTSVFHPPQP